MNRDAIRLAGLAVLAACLLGSPAMAADLGGTVQLHGFGGWAYGKTDGSHYLTGSEEGDYSHAEFFLNVHSQPTENLAVFAQVGWSQDDHGSEAIFDYAFAEWSFSDAVRARVGRVKHPFGIYGELQRVGTLRPFLNLPQALYGPQGFIGNGYNGVGLTGQIFAGSSWTLGYDIYGGQLRAEVETPNLLIFSALPDPAYLNDGVFEAEVTVDDLIGGRLDVGTPLAGVRFGASAYAGSTTDDLSGSGSRTVIGLHGEYAGEHLLVRAEYLRQDQSLDVDAIFDTNFTGAYLEAAWKFGENWQIAARYDKLEVDWANQDIRDFPRYLQSYFEHDDLSFGINYWFNNHFVVKLSYHMVEGIRMAHPQFDDPLAVLLRGEFEDEVDLVQFGGQFSF